MMNSVTKYALAGCAALMVSGCATQQSAAPQYRLSAPSAQTVEGTSMLQRGRAQLAAGLDALAIGSFRAEIRFNPDNADAYNGLAVAYGRIGRNDLAQRYFEIALAKDPLNVKVQANLAKLPGNEGFKVQQASAQPLASPYEPVAVTADALKQVPLAFDVVPPLLLLAAAQIEADAKSDAPPMEILAKRGILSARFAMASASVTVRKAPNGAVLRTAMPVQPVRLPTRPSERPMPYLQSDVRVGARLERVSLNEVRLITFTPHQQQAPRPKRSFDNFGDRLALWLPAYMSAEQAASRYRGDENIVIMAAAERAATKKRIVAASYAGANARRTAYVFVGHSKGRVGT